MRCCASLQLISYCIGGNISCEVVKDGWVQYNCVIPDEAEDLWNIKSATVHAAHLDNRPFMSFLL